MANLVRSPLRSRSTTPPLLAPLPLHRFFARPLTAPLIQFSARSAPFSAPIPLRSHALHTSRFVILSTAPICRARVVVRSTDNKTTRVIMMTIYTVAYIQQYQCATLHVAINRSSIILVLSDTVGEAGGITATGKIKNMAVIPPASPSSLTSVLSQLG